MSSPASFGSLGFGSGGVICEVSSPPRFPSPSLRISCPCRPLHHHNRRSGDRNGPWMSAVLPLMPNNFTRISRLTQTTSPSMCASFHKHGEQHVSTAPRCQSTHGGNASLPAKTVDLSNFPSLSVSSRTRIKSCGSLSHFAAGRFVPALSARESRLSSSRGTSEFRYDRFTD